MLNHQESIFDCIDASRTSNNTYTLAPFKKRQITLFRFDNRHVYDIIIILPQHTKVEAYTLLKWSLNSYSSDLKYEREGLTEQGNVYVVYSMNIVRQNPFDENNERLKWQEVHLMFENKKWIDQTVKVSCIRSPVLKITENIFKEIDSDFSYHKQHFRGNEFANMIRQSTSVVENTESYIAACCD